MKLPDLIPLGILTIRVKEHTRLLDDQGGMRVIGVASECRWEGDRLKASNALSEPTDWVSVSPSGTGTVDARMTLQTDDGAIVLVRYSGRIVYRGDAGASVIVAPTFESYDDRYRWLNGIQAIGKGERVGDRLVYEMYAVQ